MTPHTKTDTVTLYCGDSATLLHMAPENSLWIIDPPWEIDVFMPTDVPRIVFCDGGRFGGVIDIHGAPSWVFTWDCVSSWYTKNRPLRRAKYALFYGSMSSYRFDGAHYGGTRSADPRVVRNTRSEYLFTPSAKGRHLSDVFVQPITQLHKNGHKHEKPLDWMRMLIANCIGSCSSVFDPFAGSGASLDAARTLGIPSIGIELDPLCCDSIASRLGQSVIPC